MPFPPVAAAPSVAEVGAEDAVQLLTPEGERVSHPDYDVDLTDQQYRDLYRDLVLVRRVDVEATALWVERVRDGRIADYMQAVTRR